METLDMTANNLRALVVDDAPAMRQLLRIVLRGIGISDVMEAEHGDEALAMTTRTPQLSGGIAGRTQ